MGKYRDIHTRRRYWYEVTTEKELDNVQDFTYGSHDLYEAKDMAVAMGPEAYLVMIDDNDPDNIVYVCPVYQNDF